VGREAPLVVAPGEACWFRRCRYALLALAAAGLLVTDAPLEWKSLSLLGLSLTSLVAGWRLRLPARYACLRLYPDGLATLLSLSGSEVPATWGTRVWVSSRFCVVPVTRLDKPSETRLLICRSKQQPDDYRRLLGMLRLRSGSTRGNGILHGP